MTDQQDAAGTGPATLTDDDIETRPLGTRPVGVSDDTGDTGDDTGDTSDTSDTGDDSGDTSDTGDDAGGSGVA